MKKALYFLLMVVGLTSCYNQDIMYDDYETQSVYFPFQYPVRTLSLGNDIQNNSLDKLHKFNIGICIGGLYMENRKNWTVHFEVDNSLVYNYLVNVKGDTLKALPAEYYTLNPASTVTIPKGSFSGLIEVQLTDAFFQDPVAIKGNYVIPLKIADSPDDVALLTGTAAEGISNPNIHLASDWAVIPRNYTLFGIKYVNPYHGTWLRRGKMVVRNTGGVFLDTIAYRTRSVEFDIPTALTTSKLNEVTGNMNVENELWHVTLSVAGDKTISIQSMTDSPVSVSGTGKYVENGDSWGGTPEKPTPRDAIYLNYSYTRTDGNICEVHDTLVFRDRGIKVEEARPTIK
ncbi:MAG: DUF1735 domain-containing protein [Bacteroidales bacterium]